MTLSETAKVHVALGERSYDIHIGPDLIDRAGELICEVLPKSRMAIVTDTHLAEHHLDRLENALAAKGIDFSSFIIKPGEGSKNFDTFGQLVSGVIGGRFERGDAILALGGGVMGDLAGFVAGVVRRGMRFVQVPTSLLAQVDSSVGGKTGINSDYGKNLIGVFHQPDLVLADSGVLETLPPREFRAGYAEVVKYGLIDKPDFFEWLEKNREAVFAGGSARTHAIAVSCRAKAEIVARDERETGDRALLNLGHTFGHALEALTGYSQRLVHGEGVAIGTVLAHEFSVRLGLCPQEVPSRVAAHLHEAGLPTKITDIAGEAFSLEAMMDAIAQDKKVKRGNLTFILTRGIGQSFIAKDVDGTAVREFLAEKLQG